MNGPQSTASPTELPALTPENAAEILAGAHLPRPPLDALPHLIEHPRGFYEWTDATRTLNGAPVEWFAFLDDESAVRVMHEEWPCSVAGCRGHSLNEADAWSDLTHFIGTTIVGERGTGATLARFVKDDRGGVSVTVEVETEVTSWLQADAIATLLESSAAAVRRSIEAVR